MEAMQVSDEEHHPCRCSSPLRALLLRSLPSSAAPASLLAPRGTCESVEASLLSRVMVLRHAMG